MGHPPKPEIFQGIGTVLRQTRLTHSEPPLDMPVKHPQVAAFGHTTVHVRRQMVFGVAAYNVRVMIPTGVFLSLIVFRGLGNRRVGGQDLVRDRQRGNHIRSVLDRLRDGRAIIVGGTKTERQGVPGKVNAYPTTR